MLKNPKLYFAVIILCLLVAAAYYFTRPDENFSHLTLDQMNLKLHGPILSKRHYPESPEDEKMIRAGLRYKELSQSEKYTDCNFTRKELNWLRDYRKHALEYYSTPPTSEYHKYYAKKYFFDGLRATYLLEGRSAAETWAKKHFDDSIYKKHRPDYLQKNIEHHLSKMEAAAALNGWTAPIKPAR
ncbi:hypothetical protein GF348_17460 [candidate division KSB3 bacterium]|nr:hypothetical protein [candidate division KSB3 bacterium]